MQAGYPVVDSRGRSARRQGSQGRLFGLRFSDGKCVDILETIAAAKVTLLNPIDEISAQILDGFIGAVKGDLSSRHGRVFGTAAVGQQNRSSKSPNPSSQAYPITNRFVLMRTWHRVIHPL